MKNLQTAIKQQQDWTPLDIEQFSNLSFADVEYPLNKENCSEIWIESGLYKGASLMQCQLDAINENSELMYCLIEKYLR